MAERLGDCRLSIGVVGVMKWLGSGRRGRTTYYGVIFRIKLPVNGKEKEEEVCGCWLEDLWSRKCSLGGLRREVGRCDSQVKINLDNTPTMR